jgi:hypothetical protein
MSFPNATVALSMSGADEPPVCHPPLPSEDQNGITDPFFLSRHPHGEILRLESIAHHTECWRVALMPSPEVRMVAAAAFTLFQSIEHG